MKGWRKLDPELFEKQPYYCPGYGTYPRLYWGLTYTAPAGKGYSGDEDLLSDK